VSVRLPTEQEIESIAGRFDLHLEAEELASYHRVVSGMLGGFGLLDALPDGLPEVWRARTPGVRPGPDENPLGAWYVKTRIEGAADGKLSGRSVVLKDNVLLAGVPLMNGASTLEGYVPPIDATIVTRMLDAGATIVGKAVCEAYCLSGGSHTSATGPVRNPHRPEHSAGGSSSGSAALVACGEVDLAIGCDQGGSIRVPSSFCGSYGMKQTWSLVPYTGILGLEPTIDHTGPITASVADNALLLEVLAGPDGLDSRQSGVEPEPYSESLDAGVAGLRIGLLREGFGLATSEPAADASVRAAAERFAGLGAKLSEVSVPIHLAAGAIAFGSIQSLVHTVLYTDGCGTGREDLFPPSYLDFHRGWRQRADELPETVKATLLLSEYLRERHGHRLLAKSMNQMRHLRAAYDAALEQVDLLLLPTTPMKAPPLPPPDASPEEVVGHAFAPLANTQPFNHTHHPAMSIPCGTSDGLPLGAMLVGRAFEEATIYRAARAFEQHADWRTLVSP
jgi:amidase